MLALFGVVGVCCGYCPLALLVLLWLLLWVVGVVMCWSGLLLFVVLLCVLVLLCVGVVRCCWVCLLVVVGGAMCCGCYVV